MKFTITIRRPDGTKLEYEAEANHAVEAVMTATGKHFPCVAKAVAVTDNQKGK